MTATAIILTCERDKWLSDICAWGVTNLWPGVEPLVLMDTDRTTEAPLPPDIREMVRKMPVLRRVFDVPFISPTEDVYSLDSDCLIYSHPDDFAVPAYQGVAGRDPEMGLRVWKALGYGFPITKPRFCGGMYSYKKSDFLGMKDLAIEYLRRCRLMEVDGGRWPGVVCEQSLIAGMWHLLYRDNPLEYVRYPINVQTGAQVIFHISDGKWTEKCGGYVAAYKKAYKC